MSIYKGIAKWKADKKVRHAAVVAYMDEHGTGNVGSLINRLHDEKKKIKDSINCLSGFGCPLRDTRFKLMNELKWRYHESEYQDKKRNVVSAVTSMRLQNGNPAVFREDYDAPFWFDIQSKYLPDENLEKAECHGIIFHKMTMLMLPGMGWKVTREKSKVGHCGLWTIVELEDYDAELEVGDRRKAFVCAFESITDAVEFRLRYEFERIADSA
jgi:hypothetical protein